MSKAAGGISALRTVGTFANGRACSDALFHVLETACGHRGVTDEERALQPLAGGIMQHGYQCGMLWGAVLAAGARAHRLLGPGPVAEARTIVAAQRLVESFRARNRAIDCYDITGTDRSSSALKLTTYFLLKGGSIGCFRMAAAYAPVASRDIETALCDEAAAPPAGPVSCSAALARRMGVSEAHAVMVAGFAGGIGLSGGACGALGAAIWIGGLTSLQRGARIAYKSPAALDTIDRFLRCTGHELECAQIAGRKFESAADHAAHLRGGGCSKLLEVLATG